MTNRFFSGILFGYLLISPLLTQAQSLKDTVSNIQKILSDYIVETGPGGVLLINRGDQTIYQEAFGSSNLESLRLNKTNTVFEAGSVSKQFTATAILMMMEEGKISFEEDVRNIIPELPIYKKPIKIRHLLNHTSGLKDWGAIAAISDWARGTKVFTNELALEIIIKQPDLNNLPGDEYIYSNSNYTLLTIIAERVSGMKLPEFTQKYIFDKLNMKHTEWRTDFRKIVIGRATAYGKRGDQFVLQMPFENTYGHAALLTTVADLDKWNQSWKNTSLGKGKLLELRVQRGVLNDGTIISYASGVHVKDLNGQKEISHSGSTGGYKTWLAYYPESELSIVFLSNAGNINPSGLGQKIASYMLGAATNEMVEKEVTEQFSAKESSAKSDKYTGKYISNATEGFLFIKSKNKQLEVKNAAGEVRTFNRISPGKFRQESASIELHFIENAAGQPAYLLVQDPRARNIRFQKIANRQ